MNQIIIFALKSLRKIYSTISVAPSLSQPKCEQNPDKASTIIYNILLDTKPCMIARFGSTELSIVLNYVGVQKDNRSIWRYIKSEQQPWWWEQKRIEQMQNWSGFFPAKEKTIIQFCELMLSDIKMVDILGSWLNDEMYFDNELQNANKITFEILNPYFATVPWTKALENRKVLVVHPFALQIESQYKKRKLLFQNENILPEFKLETIQAVQSLGGDCSDFDTWFDALEYMKAEIDKRDYDICLIGCGAYGFPLAAHVKRTGKKAVHLGGSLQLLFGIKGKRWENPDYNPIYNYAALMNEYWVYPDESTKPKNANQVEGACYW